MLRKIQKFNSNNSFGEKKSKNGKEMKSKDDEKNAFIKNYWFKSGKTKKKSLEKMQLLDRV